MSAPIVSFDGIGYIITLFRRDATGDATEKTYVFGDHALSVCRAHKDDWQARALSTQRIGEPADDGFIYYLYAQPHDVGAPVFTWLQNKMEANALRNAIEDAENAE